MKFRIGGRHCTTREFGDTVVSSPANLSPKTSLALTVVMEVSLYLMLRAADILGPNGQQYAEEYCTVGANAA
ncbi:hypothetical protein RvVAT039_36340 [Agrobacterium vitis]|nr:hypothetical protein RvVAT039_36340 [Agrobacterium vitis]